MYIVKTIISSSPLLFYYNFYMFEIIAETWKYLHFFTIAKIVL